MKGSLRTQLTGIIKASCRFGQSRHQAKKEHGGKSPFIHSVGSFEKIIRRLWPLLDWLMENGIKDIEALNDLLLMCYLEARLVYHLEKGNACHTFQAELSALAKLETCLNAFSGIHRSSPRKYDFSDPLKEFRKRVRTLGKKERSQSRALPRPLELIACLDNPRHTLMAEFQLHTGCRTEGIGAPQRDYPGSNRLRPENFMQPEGGDILTPVPDPITRQPVHRFWTVEKGGKLAWKHCPLPLAERFFQYCETHPEGLTDKYTAYLKALNKAMKLTGQDGNGRGTHSLRFNFAQTRYLNCMHSGMGDEEAKLFVSREMSHSRPSVTGGYLG